MSMKRVDDKEWSTFSQDPNIIHVYPINDERPHTLKGTECRCKPVRKQEPNGVVIVHNAYDCREVIEEAERIKNSVSI